MEKSLIAVGLAIIFGALFYVLRIRLVRKPSQMRRFLNKRFDVIQRTMKKSKSIDYIDEAMIRRWGLAGWLLIPLPAFCFSMITDQRWMIILGLPGLLLLVFAGMFFGDSCAGVKFLRILQTEQYRKKAEQDAADDAGSTSVHKFGA